MTGRELLIVQNTGAGAGTITVSSVADPQGRSGDITTYSLPAGTFAVLGPFIKLGWMQSDGTLHFTGSAATILVAVIQVPPTP